MDDARWIAMCRADKHKMTNQQFIVIRVRAAELRAAATVLFSEIDQLDPDGVHSMMENIDEAYQALTAWVEKL